MRQGSRIRGRSATAAALAIAALAVSGPAAVAASPGQSGYSAPAGKVQQEVRRHDPAGHEGGGGSLPFTGLDIVFVVGAGGVLTVLGLGVRRLTRRPGAVA